MSQEPPLDHTANCLKAFDDGHEVLSYQFHVKVAYADGKRVRPEASGIIIPDPDQRIRMADFISFAIGTFVSKHPHVSIPLDVYLIGHFTRADVPAFSDFLDTIPKMASNIRNTFVSIDSNMKLVIDDNREKPPQLKVRLRDTILLAPSNAKSLDDIGGIIGYSKARLADNIEQEIHIKKHMKEYQEANWLLFRDYSIRDAEICVKYSEHVMDKHNELFDTFKLPTTLTSLGIEIAEQSWQQKGWDPLKIMGKEIHVEKVYNKNLGYKISQSKTLFIEEVCWLEEFVTATYHGGRNEQFLFGPAPSAHWNDFDLSSAYATAMSITGMPDWNKIEDKLVEADIKTILPDDLAFLSVAFEFPTTVRFPTLPVRTDSGLLFPRKGRSFCGAAELHSAMALGAEIRFVKGIRVPTNRDQTIFTDLIRHCLDSRKKHPKGSFNDLFWKEIGNSTYGKTAQGLKKKRVFDLRDQKMKYIPPSKLTQPLFASFITSFVRALIGEICNALPCTAQVFSATTDGFLTTASDAEIDTALKGPLALLFSDAQHKIKGKDARILEIKHTIRQPIGWRTRGSATLQCGNQPENNIVLQKGGLKTDSALNEEQSNEYVVKLFLDRTPETIVEYQSGIQLRDMIKHDSDFVYTSRTKHASMEFDWKRKPIHESVTDEVFSFNGNEYSHLAFETGPMEDASEFDHYRASWDRYTKKSRKCLKTKRDYEAFDKFLKTQKLPPDVKRYIRREEGGMHRLRVCLSRAFKHREAGFNHQNCAKTTHPKFMAALNASGIPCKPHDIKNALNTPFEFNMCLRGPEELLAFAVLKRDYFPFIKEGDFFVKDDAL